jgi:hypothetical protein
MGLRSSAQQGTCGCLSHALPLKTDMVGTAGTSENLRTSGHSLLKRQFFRSPGTTCRSIRRLRDSQSGVVDLLVAEIFNLVVRPCGHDADPGLLRAFARAAGGRGFTAAALVPMASALREQRADRGE